MFGALFPGVTSMCFKRVLSTSANEQMQNVVAVVLVVRLVDAVLPGEDAVVRPLSLSLNSASVLIQITGFGDRGRGRGAPRGRGGKKPHTFCQQKNSTDFRFQDLEETVEDVEVRVSSRSKYTFLC